MKLRTQRLLVSIALFGALLGLPRAATAVAGAAADDLTVPGAVEVVSDSR